MFGVEPCEVKNMLIYFKYGFTNFIKAVNEKEPAKNENEEPREVLVNYYLKVILKTQQSFSFHYPSENAYALDLAEDRSDNSG